MRFSTPFIKPATIVSYFIKDLYWVLPNDKNEIYLTFDDGPIPEVTPWVLEVLKEKECKATFFCVGQNVVNHPTIYHRILEEGHQVGNHSHTHMEGWRSDNETYFQDIDQAAQHINSNLFRPPYGRIGPQQIKHLTEKYHIIMWDILPKDYDPEVTPQDCINTVKSNLKSGSIIVLHDSLKAEKNLKESLEEIIDFGRNQGFHFGTIKI